KEPNDRCAPGRPRAGPTRLIDTSCKDPTSHVARELHLRRAIFLPLGRKRTSPRRRFTQNCARAVGPPRPPPAMRGAASRRGRLCRRAGRRPRTAHRADEKQLAGTIARYTRAHSLWIDELGLHEWVLVSRPVSR